MPEYRRRTKTDVWHWCSNCSDWPTGTPGVDYESQRVPRGERPSSGELDNQCRSKERNNNCNTV